MNQKILTKKNLPNFQLIPVLHLHLKVMYDYVHFRCSKDYCMTGEMCFWEERYKYMQKIQIKELTIYHILAGHITQVEFDIS